MPRRKQSGGFIGYVRVSTERQGDEGNSLAAQTFQLREYVRGVGGELEIVPAMEPGHGPINGRPRFLEALKKAEERGWRLLVIDPSRLSREVQHLKLIDLRKTPVWVYRAGRISKQDLIKAVKAASWELKQLRQDGAAGARARRVGFHGEDAQTKAADGRKSGGNANADRAHRNVLRVQGYIERLEGGEQQSHRELANALNTAGIMNRVKEKPFTDKHWTVQSLRPVRKTAMERIALDRTIDEEEAEASQDSAGEALSSAPTHDVGPALQADRRAATRAPGVLGKTLGWVKSLVRGIADHFRG